MLEFDDLSFRFRDYLFKDYSDRIVENRVGIVGRNGTGKTTLLKLVDGRLEPEHGALRVSGETYLVDYDLGRFKHFHARDLLSLCSVLESFDTRRALEYVEQLGMTDYLDVPVGELSKGTAKKVSLVMGLCSRAEILLLDEPFEGLDRQSNDYLTALLKTEDRRCIVVSHDLEELERSVEAVYAVTGRRLERAVS
ncbi:NitT/TauT family transport system ATP-binding protein [Micrococcus terreus]|uniref:NitT/TauT family transport system ATP-binding protein n=1 Tax=Micrococcus terreus TaxID=574650 RepID=A0A1I7MQ46_9MICC|nr:NitT/TauT family transport system ATP-binding protein [Micrococcus terreus]